MVDLPQDRAGTRPGTGSRGGTIEAHTRLRPAPTSAREARRFARSTLLEWGLTAAADVVELLVSELVTNSVLHARSEVEVRLRATESTLRVDVVDGSPRQPVLRTRDDKAMTGRGLALVAELSTEWGVDETPDGKSVWFVVAA